MNKIFVAMAILLIGMAFVFGNEASEIEEGKKLVEKGTKCSELNDEQLEEIGEYYMEQMHPGEAHELMHKMMGLEEGSDAHEQFHINMARRMYCNEDVGYGMIGSGMMMPMMQMMGGNGMVNSGNMMGNGKIIRCMEKVLFYTLSFFSFLFIFFIFLIFFL